MSKSAVESARVSRRSLLKSGGAVAALGGMAIMPISASKVSAQEGWDRETDVVVVGTGAAGTPAALEAARAGAEVLRLEKTEWIGGNMSHSGGIIYLGGGTELQQRHGFEDTPEQMAAYLNAFMAPWDDPEFVRFYSENTAEHFDWLVGEGVPFGPDAHVARLGGPPGGVGGLAFSGNEPNYPYNEITPPIPRGHYVVGGGAAMSTALQASADAEPNITTEINAPVTGLIADDDGRVVGVVAEIDGGEQYILARKAVVLGTGGYEFNETMLQRTLTSYHDLDPVGSAYRGNTGDGIRLAAGLGARLRNMDQTFVVAPVSGEERMQSILVNGQGRRFVNEASYGSVIGREILQHHNNIAWLIMDQAVADSIVAFGSNLAEPYASAETIAELAEAIDVPAVVLEQEVAFYNSLAEAGFDSLFRKPERLLSPLVNPPYRVYNHAITFAMTAGHIEIDLDARVLDQELNPIPGLYAAGQGACGLGRWHYNSGIRLGEGTLFGRVAGRNAAAAEAWSGGAFHVAAATSVSSEQPEATEDDDAASSGAIVIEAFDIGFDVTEVTIPADVDTDIEVVNAGSIPHDLVIEDTEYATPILVPGRSEILTVNLPAGEYIYFCSVPGHRGGGMEGTLIAE